ACLTDTSPNPCCVDETPGNSTERHQRVDRVPRRSGNSVDHGDMLARHLVKQAGLTDIWTAQQCDTTRTATPNTVFGRGLREGVEDRVEQLSTPPPMQRADGVWLAETQRPKTRCVGLALCGIHLVSNKYDRLACLAQNPRDRLVRVGRTDSRIDDHHDDLRSECTYLGLGRNLRLKAERGRLPSPGVDDSESPATPVRVVHHPVTCHTGYVFDDRFTPTEDSVDQGRLSDVGPANDGDERDRGSHEVLSAGIGDLLGLVVVCVIETDPVRLAIPRLALGDLAVCGFAVDRLHGVGVRAARSGFRGGLVSVVRLHRSAPPTLTSAWRRQVRASVAQPDRGPGPPRRPRSSSSSRAAPRPGPWPTARSPELNPACRAWRDRL